MDRHKGIVRRVTQSMNLMSDAVPGLPLVEIAGEHRVLIENHKGIVKYAVDEIIVRVPFGYFRVIGEKLKLLQMTDARLVIGGSIQGVEIEKKV